MQCPNPFCPAHTKYFASERAYSQHVHHSTQCFKYLCDQSAGSSLGKAGRATTKVHTLTHTQSRRTLTRDLQNTNLSSTKIFENDRNETHDDFGTNGFDNDFDHLESHTSHRHYVFTTDQKWTVKLLKILNNIDAPDHVFADIILWARDAMAEQYSFYPPGGLSRQSNIKVLFDSMHNASQLLPVIVPVSHATKTDHVIVFDFVSQLFQLLQNKTIMIQENLLIDIQNPLKKYQNPNGQLADALSGSVYQSAYDRLITNPQKQLFVPIIQWIDRTNVTGNDRFSLKPYMFTPAIFTEPFRRTIKAWAYHGFLPKPNLSSAENRMQDTGSNLRQYHQQLSTVLQSFQHSAHRLKDIVLPIGPTGSMRIDIVTCILFIIQDMQEGDALCGRYGPHTPQINRHCRSCNVNYEQLDDPEIKCQYLYAEPMHIIEKSNDPDLHKKWSQHKLANAFAAIEFGDPDRGIFGATPIETMHAFRKGMIETVTFLVLDNVPSRKKATLDQLAKQFHEQHRQTYRHAYPSTDFSNGITNLSKISASERLGLVFLFVILAQYDHGWAIINDALKGRTDTNLTEILELFEAMLCFDAWLSQSSFWNVANEKEATTSLLLSIQILMNMCRHCFPGRWNFPKFHELLHIPDDMKRFGAPINFCAQRPESLLKEAAKRPGRRAFKRHKDAAYELSAAQRLAGSLIIDIAFSKMHDVKLKDDTSNDLCEKTVYESTKNATQGVLEWIPESEYHPEGSHRLTWNTSTKLSLMNLPTSLMHFLTQHFGHQVSICTQYQRDQFIFRCHPNYQSNGPINDWLLIRFEDDTYPSRLACVVNTPNAEESVQLIIQCAVKRTGIKSAIFTEWTWSPEYYVVSPNTIHAPCFIVSILPNHSKILETLPYEDWPTQFT